MRTIAELQNFIFSLPGNPRVKIIEQIGELTIQCHRHHKNRINEKKLRKYFAIGIYLTFQYKPHSYFCNQFEVDLRNHEFGPKVKQAIGI